ncbi:MAG TPA: hypothetical protein VMY05_12575 [Acidobacteriota bacterium]|nr:hypothetical protein [Acidobacteriota bacterium]
MKEPKLLLTGLRLGVVLLLALALAAGCSGDKDGSGTPGTGDSAGGPDSTDIREIAAMFREAAVRWHHGDKAVLYDLEFEYVRNKYTFDEYLEFKQIKYLEADSLEMLVLKDIEFFDYDSAIAVAEAVFVGPSGDTSYYPDRYRLYYQNDRWIHPTFGTIDYQLEYEDLRRVADSAAAAEAELEDF